MRVKKPPFTVGIQERMVSAGFRFPYVLSTRRLKEELAYRSAKRTHSGNAWGYLKGRWGITKKYLKRRIEDKGIPFGMRGVFISRHVARADLEVLDTRLIAKRVDLEWGVVQLTLDSWMDQPYKSSLLRPVLWDVGSGGVEKLKFPRPKPGIPLSNLVTDTGESLIEFHQQGIRNEFPDAQVFDRSEMESEMVYLNLKYGKEKIPSIFAIVGEELVLMRYDSDKKFYIDTLGKEYSIEDILELNEQGKVKPSGEWAYNEFYLMMPGILFPEMAFIITPWEEDDQQIQDYARAVYNRASKVSGMYPLCIPIPNYPKLASENVRLNLSKRPENVTIVGGSDELLLGVSEPMLEGADLWNVSFNLLEAVNRRFE